MKKTANTENKRESNLCQSFGQWRDTYLPKDVKSEHIGELGSRGELAIALANDVVNQILKRKNMGSSV